MFIKWKHLLSLHILEKFKSRIKILHLGILLNPFRSVLLLLSSEILLSLQTRFRIYNVSRSVTRDLPTTPLTSLHKGCLRRRPRFGVSTHPSCSPPPHVDFVSTFRSFSSRSCLPYLIFYIPYTYTTLYVVKICLIDMCIIIPILNHWILSCLFCSMSYYIQCTL